MESLDLEYLAYEMEVLINLAQEAFDNRMITFLKKVIEYQYQLGSGNGKKQIKKHRGKVLGEYFDSPSLKSHMDEPLYLKVVWHKAKERVSRDTGMSIDFFATDCPASIYEMLFDNWLPERVERSASLA